MSLGSKTKDPADIRNYAIDWSAWLTSQGSDTISSSSWTGGGLTIASSSNTSTTATAKVSGGADGQAYTVSNTIITATGMQTRKVSFQLNVNTQ
jgi:hypothetical protein